MHWDNTVLNFECVRRFNLPSWSGGGFNSTTPGTLLVGWDDPSGAGVTHIDGVRIVDVCFKAVGASGAATTVTIDSIGFPAGNGGAEAINAMSKDVWTSSSHINGASGVSAPINIIVTPPDPTWVTYTLDQDIVAPGVQTCVDVKVKNFTSITSAEFALSYNPSELAHVSNQFGANPLNLVASNVTVPTLPMPLPALHYVKFLWSNPAGATVANDVAIFSACFNAIAPPNTTSPVNITTTPCPQITGIGTAKLTGGVPVALVNGWVKVEQTSCATLTATPVTCNGTSTGAITLVPTCPQPTYAWAGPAGYTSAAQNPTGLKAGIYTVTVSSPGSNTTTATVQVTEPPAITETHTVNTLSCATGNNGAIALTPAGGSPPYMFTWSNGATTEDINTLIAGTYTVTIKDSKNCTFTSPAISVGGPAALVLNPNTDIIVTHVTCAGLTNGGITITPKGGIPPYTYNWGGGVTTKDRTNLAAGPYIVTVTDANGCTTAPVANIVITAPPALSVELTGKTDVKCMGTPTGSASINVMGGTGNKSYCWVLMPGSNCVNPQVQNPTNLMAGMYKLVVTDANGCTNNQIQNIIVNPPTGGQLVITNSTTPSLCFDTPSGAIDLTVTGGWNTAYTYAWSGGLMGPDPSPVPPGTYTVTVTDAGQCTSTQAVTVTGSTAITESKVVQDATCFGENNGGINLNLAGGNPPYNVVWTNTSLTGDSIGNLSPGNYQPMVTDNAGCAKTFPEVTVAGPAELMVEAVVSETNPATGSIDFTIVSGGTPNFTFLWTGPNGFTAATEDISGAGVVAGDYTVVVKDSNNCERTFNYEVPEGNVLFGGDGVEVLFIKDVCDNDGCIKLGIPPTAEAHAPFVINWGGSTQPSTSSTLTIEKCNLAPGIYTPTVTASNGNSVVLAPITIVQLNLATVKEESQNTFDEMDNGQIELTPQVPDPMLYQWAPPIVSSSNLVTGLDSGLYVVTVTNLGSGCTSVHEFHLERQYADLVLSTIASANPNCAAVPTGSIDLKVVGGNAPYTYQWIGPNGFTATTEDLNGLMPGFYSVTVTDENDTLEIKTYTLTAQSSLAITNVNELSNHNGWQVSGAGMCDGVAVVVFIPGSGNTSVVWSNGTTGVSNNTLCGGAYSVTVFDGLGCSSVWTNELTSPPAISATDTSVSVTCHAECDGTATVIVEGGVEPYKVEWSTGQKDPAVFEGGFSQAVNLCGGQYVVTITDQNDVVKIFPVTVTEPDEIEIIFSPTVPRNFNSCDGDLLAEVTGATLPITYVWSGSFGHRGDGERAEGLCSGEFIEFVITDANGCSAYASDSIAYPEDGCFRVSPIITPELQDGKNDNVYITCIEVDPDNVVEIYNRWGQIVFETEGYTNNDSDREHNWNGLTKAGAPLPEGVYYYVLSFTDDEGNKHQRKGAINLLR